MSPDSIPAMTRSTIANRIAAVLGTRVDANLESVKNSDLLGALGKEFKAPYIELTDFTPDIELLKVFGEGDFASHLFVPLYRCPQAIFCATPEPWNVYIPDICRQKFGSEIDVIFFQVDKRSVLDFLHKHHLAAEFDSKMKAERMADERGTDDESKVKLDTQLNTAWGLLSDVFIKAIHHGATDIHIQPEESEVRVRAEINGTLQDFGSFPRNLARSIENSIYNQSASTMREDFRRIPQHGNISFDYEDRHIDLRVASVPSYSPSGGFNTHFSIRFQDSRRNENVELTTLGFPEETLKHIIRAIESPGALCIVAGPTGSGKTTTLGACIKHLNAKDRMIYSVEDPVENFYPGVVHLLAKEQTVKATDGGRLNVTFGQYVRTLLRKKPNVILIGEIRDKETGEAVIEAAMTGHIVLTTLHVDFAHEIPERLSYVGIQPFQISTKLQLCSSQRLIKVLCHYCAETYTCTDKDAETYHYPKDFVGRSLKRHFPEGCNKCNKGYTDRKAIIEVIHLDDAIREAIASGIRSQPLQQLVSKTPHYKSLRDLALESIANHQTDYYGVRDVIRL
jgi:type IV pilus assembly protein PilB